MTELYLAFIEYLIEFQCYGANYLTQFLKLIENSYWNYYCLSKILHRIIKIIPKSYSNFKSLIELCFNISKVNITNAGLKKFIGLLKYSNTEHTMIILDTVLAMLKSTSPQEVFVFQSNRESGMDLCSKSFPKDGYCFFGFLRLEPSSPYKSMCIYKFVSESRSQISLFMRGSKLCYKVYNSQISQMTDTSFDYGTISNTNEWFFIELYHTNASHKNLVFSLY